MNRIAARDQVVLADDGVRLWATRVGDGNPVVVCHGGPGLWDMFSEVAESLRDSVAVHRWDQRGCGRSQRCGPYSIARTIADLEAIRRHFGLDRFALLGHSWGAHLALLYALAHPERVSRLVYVSGTGIDPGMPWHEPYALNLRDRLGTHLERWEALRRRDRTDDEDRELCVLQWSADFIDRDQAMEHANRMATPWLGVNFECSAAINIEVKRLWDSAALQRQCQDLAVPTLIVDGTEDIRPRWSVDSLEHTLPTATRAAIARAGHLPWVEEPEAFRRTLTTFLAT